jgi:hypothetical protein
VFLGAVVYLIAGLAFATLAKGAATAQLRVTWRLAAWVVSAVVAATVHAQAVSSIRPAYALVLWPVLTGVPAFIVALGAAVAGRRAPSR